MEPMSIASLIIAIIGAVTSAILAIVGAIGKCSTSSSKCCNIDVLNEKNDIHDNENVSLGG